MYRKEYRYHRDHYWVHDQGELWGIGITNHAQSELQEISYVDLPAPGAVLRAGEAIGVVESIKAAVELIAPVSGEVIEVNGKLRTWPGLLNEDPHGEGWMVKLRPSLASLHELDDLMSAEQYEEWTASRSRREA